MLDLFTEFELYRQNNTKPMHSVYTNKFELPFERLDDPVRITLFLQNYWHHTITIGILYYLIMKLIEWIMRDKEPFELRKPMVLWNGGLALFSVCGLIRFSEEPLHNLLNEGFVYTICHTANPRGVSAFWAFLFLLSKFVEFGDTLFIVLRKKRPIFLHYYHHAAVMVYSVHVGAEHTGACSLFIPMNFFAHSLMYLYYALTSLRLKVPRQFAVFVTSVQTAQMLFGVAITGIVFKVKVIDGKRCQQSMGNLYLAIFLYATFAILFIKFFYGAYLKKQMKENDQKKNKSE